MRSQNFRIEAEGEGSYEDVKDALNALDLDMEDIKSFAVEIGTETTAEKTRSVAEARRPGLVGIKEPEIEPGVEYSDVTEPEPQPNKGPKGPVDADRYEGKKYEGHVMPDTKFAAVMRTIDGDWLEAHSVREQLDFEISYNQVSAHLSSLFKKGYLKRRNEGGQHDPYEYTVTEQGNAALRRGEQKMAAQ